MPTASEKGGVATRDPFWWEEGPDGIRLRCTHPHGTHNNPDSWTGPWRSDPSELAADEDAHDCDRAARWRVQRDQDPRVAA